MADKKHIATGLSSEYQKFATGIAELLSQARRQAARSVNAILTATYWETGRRIVEFEQKGKARAPYGEAVLKRLSGDLTQRLGRGFSVDHLELMRKFYLDWPLEGISESPLRKSPTERISESSIRNLQLSELAKALPLS